MRATGPALEVKSQRAEGCRTDESNLSVLMLADHVLFSRQTAVEQAENDEMTKLSLSLYYHAMLCPIMLIGHTLSSITFIKPTHTHSPSMF